MQASFSQSEEVFYHITISAISVKSWYNTPFFYIFFKKQVYALIVSVYILVCVLSYSQFYLIHSTSMLEWNLSVSIYFSLSPPFLHFLVCQFCYAVLSVLCSLVVTSWERADLLALVYCGYSCYWHFFIWCSRSGMVLDSIFFLIFVFPSTLLYSPFYLTILS